ncbi:hypothetical protein PsYK624_082620 [Phanerochaete sordida]|uniref:Uncharacterized protein n=1 Tax=Phanerochaete sordida TaxID=48140 RepID=A0A9P3LF03_9APHY|nr:hypothetical protein PsYK624_082620 [Phanerochaete sordida]
MSSSFFARNPPRRTLSSNATIVNRDLNLASEHTLLLATLHLCAESSLPSAADSRSRSCSTIISRNIRSVML